MMNQSATMDSIIPRAMGVLQLNDATYEEIEHDQAATTQAAIIVAVAALAGAIGGLDDGGSGFIAGLVGGFVGLARGFGRSFLCRDAHLAIWSDRGRLRAGPAIDWIRERHQRREYPRHDR